MIAKDKKGRPVTGLATSDFSLKDNGRPQKISFFAVQQPDAIEAKPVQQTFQQTPDRARVFSNTHLGGSSPVVLLLDLLNTPGETQPAIRKALAASLRHSISHAPTALLTLGDSLTLAGDFTTDVKSLAPLVEKPVVASAQSLGPAVTATKTSNEKANEAILKAAVKAFNWEAAGRVERTLTALNIIRSELVRMHGRKSLIWIGGGLSLSPQDWPVLRKVIEQFNDANVAIYTVDARGVLLDYGTGADVDDQDMLGPWAEEQEETRGDILDVAARSTGGVPYRNTNALDVAITRAVEDSTTVYTLGYYPPNDDVQGMAHKIEVKVARGGVNLRYRMSYVASSEAAPSAADDQQTFQAIAASPVDFPGIRFTVEMKPGGDADKLRLSLRIPATELRFFLREEKSVAAIQCWIIQRRPSGADVASKTSSFALQLTPAELASANSDGITLDYPVALQPSADRVRVMLRDVNSGRIGTVDAPLDRDASPPVSR